MRWRPRPRRPASMPRLMRHRVGAGGQVAQALAHHRPGQHRGGGGAVTGDVVGLLGDLLDEVGADVLVGILELDLLGDRHAVVGDGRGAPLLGQHDVAALGAEGDAHGVGELVHARLELAAGFFVEGDDLGHGCLSWCWTSGGTAQRHGCWHSPRESARRSSTLSMRVLTASRRAAASSVGSILTDRSRSVRCSIVVVGAGVGGLRHARSRTSAARARRHAGRARRHAAAGRRPGRLRVGPPGRAPGAPLPRLPGPAAQPAARPLSRRAGRAAGRRRHRDGLHRHAARGHGPRPASPATRTWSRWPAGARPSSGCCAASCSAEPGVELRDGAAVTSLIVRRRRRRRPSRPGSPASCSTTAPSSTPTSSCWPADGASDVPALLAPLGVTVTERGRGHRASSTSRGSSSCVDGAELPRAVGPDRRRPRLPEVRRVPGRQPHVLDHPRHSHRRRRAAGPARSTPTCSSAPRRRCRPPRPTSTAGSPSRSPRST